MKNPSKTGHLVDNQGYVSVDTPNLEKWLDSVTIWQDGSAPAARCKFEVGLKMPEQARSATGLDVVFSAKKEFNPIRY
jgi:hypothetical protein